MSLALPGSVAWETLAAINPFEPEPPTLIDPDPNTLDLQLVQYKFQSDGYRLRLQPEHTYEQSAAWQSSQPVLQARAKLDGTLKDLEDRGLVWWDRSSNSYDLHPIIRAYAYNQLENERIANPCTANIRQFGARKDMAKRVPSRTIFSIDVTSLLPPGWQDDISAVASEADFRDMPRIPVLSREAPDVTHVSHGRVHAAAVQQLIPWLYKLYRSEFLELASQAWGEPIQPAAYEQYGVLLMAQRGKLLRSECRIDPHPITGVLFVTNHPAGGGELVVSHDHSAVGVEGLEHDCTAIKPQAGQLIFFDGKTYPHYTRALKEESEIWLVARMIFYTTSSPEFVRRPKLNQHLFDDA